MAFAIPEDREGSSSPAAALMPEKAGPYANPNPSPPNALEAVSEGEVCPSRSAPPPTYSPPVIAAFLTDSFAIAENISPNVWVPTSRPSLAASPATPYADAIAMTLAIPNEAPSPIATPSALVVGSELAR